MLNWSRINLGQIPGRVLTLCWVIRMCRRFDHLFWHSGDLTRSFWGTFSHPPIPKRSFGVLKLPILTEFDLFGPKFHFSPDLFGSNFQWPAAHPHRFSDRVHPPPPPPPRQIQIGLSSPLPKGSTSVEHSELAVLAPKKKGAEQRVFQSV